MTDTGPPYPPPPSAGSNGIGEFAIGVSQIGDIAPFDFWKTIISQWANSPIIIGLISSWFIALDETEEFSNFFDLIWNVLTAEGYGLDVWGIIVGIGRVVHIADVEYFGFQEALPGIQTFNHGGVVGIFYIGEPITSNYSLSDEVYRRLILAKAAANICNGSIPAINQILINLFPGRGNAFVTEGYQGDPYFGFQEAGNSVTGFNQGCFYAGESINTMIMTYTFDFALTPVDLAIIQTGVLPKPSGVSASIVING